MFLFSYIRVVCGFNFFNLIHCDVPVAETGETMGSCLKSLKKHLQLILPHSLTACSSPVGKHFLEAKPPRAQTVRLHYKSLASFMTVAGLSQCEILATPLSKLNDNSCHKAAFLCSYLVTSELSVGLIFLT